MEVKLKVNVKTVWLEKEGSRIPGTLGMPLMHIFVGKKIQPLSLLQRNAGVLLTPWVNLFPLSSMANLC